METPRRVTSRRFCHIDCADGANIERAKHAYSQLLITSKLTHAEREYRLPLVANIEPLLAAYRLRRRRKYRAREAAHIFNFRLSPYLCAFRQILLSQPPRRTKRTAFPKSDSKRLV